MLFRSGRRGSTDGLYAGLGQQVASPLSQRVMSLFIAPQFCREIISFCHSEQSFHIPHPMSLEGGAVCVCVCVCM